MQLVCNASPLIFLAKIDLIHVLPKIAGDFRVPIGVYHEIKGQNDAAAEWIEEYKNEYVIETGAVPKIIESWDLGKGETEVIAHAYSNKDLTCIIHQEIWLWARRLGNGGGNVP
jgi:predicted nucleic acid-binding protein